MPGRPASDSGKAEDDGIARTNKFPSDLPGYWRRHAGKGDQTQHGMALQTEPTSDYMSTETRFTN
jgi:hypothetical protein